MFGLETSQKGHFHLPKFTLKLHCPLAYENHCPLSLLRDGDDRELGSLSELPAHFPMCLSLLGKWAKLEVVTNKSLPFTPSPMKQGREEGGTSPD